MKIHAKKLIFQFPLENQKEQKNSILSIKNGKDRLLVKDSVWRLSKKCPILSKTTICIFRCQRFQKFACNSTAPSLLGRFNVDRSFIEDLIATKS